MKKDILDPSSEPKNDSLVDHEFSWVQKNTKNLLSKSLDLWGKFSMNPSLSIAMELAQFYWFYPAAENVNMYPITLFVNHDTGRFVLYSDVTKSWWSIQSNGKTLWSHSLDDISIDTHTKTFQFLSLHSWERFDANFNKLSYLDFEGEIIGSSVYRLPEEHGFHMWIWVEH